MGKGEMTTFQMMLLVIGIILVLVMIIIFFVGNNKVSSFVYSYGCEGWTSLMNSIYEALGMSTAAPAC